MSSRAIRILMVTVACGLAVALVYHGVDWLFQPEYSEPAFSEDERPEEAQKAVFVGNSHTQRNHLPYMVEHIAALDGRHPPLWTQRSVGSGWTFYDHVHHDETVELITSSDVDYVVLQGHGAGPIFYPESYSQHYETLYAEAASRGAEVILVQTWPNAEGHPVYVDGAFPAGPDEAFEQIEAVVAELVEQMSEAATLAPVGRTWEAVRHAPMDYDLYDPDGNHASVAGTYLAALVIYMAIRDGELPDDAWHPDDIAAEKAEDLQQVAQKIYRGR